MDSKERDGMIDSKARGECYLLHHNVIEASFGQVLSDNGQVGPRRCSIKEYHLWTAYSTGVQQERNVYVTLSFKHTHTTLREKERRAWIVEVKEREVMMSVCTHTYLIISNSFLNSSMWPPPTASLSTLMATSWPLYLPLNTWEDAPCPACSQNSISAASISQLCRSSTSVVFLNFSVMARGLVVGVEMWEAGGGDMDLSLAKTSENVGLLSGSCSQQSRMSCAKSGGQEGGISGLRVPWLTPTMISGFATSS